jgi:hypothetical protein
MTPQKGGAMPAQPAMKEERVKQIDITLDKQGKPQIAADLRELTIDRTKDEEVIWVSDLPFRVDFKGDSPFYENQFSQTHRRSGLVRRGVVSSRFRSYEYTIEIGGKTLDPQIKVFP